MGASCSFVTTAAMSPKRIVGAGKLLGVAGEIVPGGDRPLGASGTGKGPARPFGEAWARPLRGHWALSRPAALDPPWGAGL